MPRKTSAGACVPPAAGMGFNEAAARCRGKRERHGVRRSARLPASMRPRPDAAENAGRVADGAAEDARFNEAAARCRGKLGRAHLEAAQAERLQ